MAICMGIAERAIGVVTIYEFSREDGPFLHLYAILELFFINDIEAIAFPYIKDEINVPAIKVHELHGQVV